MKTYDVIIVGGGPAGMTAALYTSRRGLKTLVVSQDIGGQAAITPEVENYPGFESVGGLELMEKFKKHAEKFGAEFLIDEAQAVNKKEDGNFTVKTASENFNTEAVILAFGLSHQHLNVPGEEQLIGRGVTYCATCDAPLFKGKKVAVVGGGNSAVDAAIYLSEIASQVHLIHRRSEFRAEEFLVNRLSSLTNIEVKLDSVIKEIKGKERVESITVVNVNEDQKNEEITVDGVFIEVGLVVKADFIKGLVNLNERNEIKISSACETSVPGIFAAGDVTAVTYKQIVISAGEGCKAALQAYLYLQEKKGKKGAVMIDWIASKKK